MASPSLLDPNFIRTVICLLGHDEAGSIGVVINRPSGTRVDDIVPEWDALAARPRQIFMGGPVQTDGALCVARITEAAARALAGPGPVLGRDSERSERADHPAGSRRGVPTEELGSPSAGAEPEAEDTSGFRPVIGALGTVNLDRSPDEVSVELVEARVFAGYAGWGPGQLETEVISGDWFVLDLNESDVFDPEPEDLWARVLRRQGAWLAVLARCPLDPSVN